MAHFSTRKSRRKTLLALLHAFLSSHYTTRTGRCVARNNKGTTTRRTSTASNQQSLQLDINHAAADGAGQADDENAGKFKSGPGADFAAADKENKMRMLRREPKTAKGEAPSTSFVEVDLVSQDEPNSIALQKKQAEPKYGSTSEPRRWNTEQDLQQEAAHAHAQYGAGGEVSMSFVEATAQAQQLGAPPPVSPESQALAPAGSTDTADMGDMNGSPSVAPQQQVPMDQDGMAMGGQAANPTLQGTPLPLAAAQQPGPGAGQQDPGAPVVQQYAQPPPANANFQPQDVAATAQQQQATQVPPEQQYAQQAQQAAYYNQAATQAQQPGAPPLAGPGTVPAQPIQEQAPVAGAYYDQAATEAQQPGTASPAVPQTQYAYAQPPASANLQPPPLPDVAATAQQGATQAVPGQLDQGTAGAPPLFSPPPPEQQAAPQPSTEQLTTSTSTTSGVVLSTDSNPNYVLCGFAGSFLLILVAYLCLGGGRGAGDAGGDFSQSTRTPLRPPDGGLYDDESSADFSPSGSANRNQPVR